MTCELGSVFHLFHALIFAKFSINYMLYLADVGLEGVKTDATSIWAREKTVRGAESSLNIALRGGVRACIAVALLVTSCGRDPGSSDWAPGTPSGAEHPNVVLIIIDTLRADKLGCYGFKHDTSPELDAYAAKGVRFSNVIAQCTWTRPSIASMLTSLYPRTLGLFEEANEQLADRYQMLAEMLKAGGYRTLGATANPNTNTLYNFAQGFDVYIDSNVIYKNMPAEAGQVYRKDKLLPTAPKMFKQVLSKIKGEREFPYYLQFNTMEMHEHEIYERLMTRDEYKGLFSDDESPQYLQALRQTSYDISEFVQELSALPGWANTIFIFTSDHGEGLLDHPHIGLSRNHGRQLYESQVKVPLILYRPDGELPGRTIERPVRLLDLVPTVLELAKVSVADEMQGVSLVPLLNDENADIGLPEYFVVESHFRETDKIAVYTSEWKYIENRDLTKNVPPRELQAIGVKEDGRFTDVGDQHPDLRQELASYIKRWESTHERVAATPLTRFLTQEEEDELQGIGYLQ